MTQLAQDWTFKAGNNTAMNSAIHLIRHEQDDKALHQGLAALKKEFRGKIRMAGTRAELAVHEEWMRTSSPQRIDTNCSRSYLLEKVGQHLTTTGQNLIQPRGNLAIAADLFKELEDADFRESDIQDLWNMGFDPKKIPDIYDHITKVALAGLRDPNETDEDKLTFVRSILDQRLIEDKVHISFSNLMDILGAVDLSTLSRIHMNELVSLAIKSVADGAGDQRALDLLDSLEIRSFEEPIRMNHSSFTRLKAVMRTVSNMTDSPHFDDVVEFSRKALNFLPPGDRAEALMYGLSDLYARSQYESAREVVAAYAKHGGVLDAISESGELEHGLSVAFLAVVFNQHEPRDKMDDSRTIHLPRTINGFGDMHEGLLAELRSAGFDLDWIFAPEQILTPLQTRLKRAMQEAGAFNNPFSYEDGGIVAPASYVLFRSFGKNQSKAASAARVLYNSLDLIDSCVPLARIKDTLRSIPIDTNREKILTIVLQKASESDDVILRKSMSLFGGIAFKFDYFDMEALMLPSYAAQRQICEVSPYLQHLPDTEEVRTGGGLDPWGMVWSRVAESGGVVAADDLALWRPKTVTAVRILNQHVEKWKLEEVGIGLYRMFCKDGTQSDALFPVHEDALKEIVAKTLERSKDASLLTEFKYQLKAIYGEASNLLCETIENLSTHELSCLVPALGQLAQQKYLNTFFQTSSAVQDGCNIVDTHLPYSRSEFYQLKFAKRRKWFFPSELSFGVTSHNTLNYREAFGQSNMRKTVIAGAGFEGREYIYGDDFRYMDWSATARTGVLHVRTAERSDAKRGYAVVDLEWLQADYKNRMPHLLSSIRRTVLASNQISMGLYYRGALLETVSAEELKILVTNPTHPKSREIFQRVDRPVRSIRFGRPERAPEYQVFPTRLELQNLPEKDRLRAGDSLIVFGEKDPPFQQQVARVSRQYGVRVAWSRTHEKTKAGQI